jgi:hypothetical protein
MGDKAAQLPLELWVNIFRLSINYTFQESIDSRFLEFHMRSTFNTGTGLRAEDMEWGLFYVKELLKLRLVCKMFNDVATSDAIWRKVFNTFFCFYSRPTKNIFYRMTKCDCLSAHDYKTGFPTDISCAKGCADKMSFVRIRDCDFKDPRCMISFTGKRVDPREKILFYYTSFDKRPSARMSYARRLPYMHIFFLETERRRKNALYTRMNAKRKANARLEAEEVDYEKGKQQYENLSIHIRKQMRSSRRSSKLAREKKQIVWTYEHKYMFFENDSTKKRKQKSRYPTEYKFHDNSKHKSNSCMLTREEFAEKGRLFIESL